MPNHPAFDTSFVDFKDPLDPTLEFGVLMRGWSMGKGGGEGWGTGTDWEPGCCQ